MSTIQGVALVNPAHQPAIVSLLETIQRLPPQTVLTPTTGKRRKDDTEERVWDTENIIWANMPTFSAQLTDMYEYMHHLLVGSPSSEAMISRWASANAFLARVASAWDPEYVFYLHRASYRFLRVLDVEGHPHFSVEVPAAANLFRYASCVLLKLCREEPPMPGVPIGIFAQKPREYEEGKKVLWNRPGYSMDRWAWWKTRWEQLTFDGELDDGIRTHAREALVVMKHAEL
jgi:hypothetical protein